jgi:hypothetical protein
LKNVPFVLVAGSHSGAKLDFTPNDTYTKIYKTQGQQAQVHVIKIPKSVVGYVEVGKYMISETVDHMPMVCFCSVLGTPLCEHNLVLFPAFFSQFQL